MLNFSREWQAGKPLGMPVKLCKAHQHQHTNVHEILDWATVIPVKVTEARNLRRDILKDYCFEQRTAIMIASTIILSHAKMQHGSSDRASCLYLPMAYPSRPISQCLINGD